MSDKLKKIARNILISFVLISIGFAFGKEVERRRSDATVSRDGPDNVPGEIVSSSDQQKVVVYYTHGNFRCTTCTSIEEQTLQTLQNRFANEMANGLVQWKVVNFQEDEAFAKRYEIVSSGVVIAGMKGTSETGHKNLEEVWTKYNDPVSFENYIAESIRPYLAQENGGDK